MRAQRQRKAGEPGIFSLPEEIRQLAGILNSGKAITILGGAGCAGAHAELMAVADKLKSPIVSALRGREHIQFDNPYDVGLTGLIGFSSGYHAIKEADMLLMLGTDFPYTQFYPEKATIIQVDRRGEHLGRRTRLDLGLLAMSKRRLVSCCRCSRRSRTTRISRNSSATTRMSAKT